MTQHIGTFSTGHVVTAAEMNALGPYYSSGAGAPAGTGANSDTYYDTTNKRGYYSDGTGWIILFEPAQSWTPSVTNFTIGTGGSAAATGYYKRSDGWIDISATLVLGTSGASVGTSLTLTLPVAGIGVRTNQLSIAFVDIGGWRYPAINDPGTTTVVLAAIDSSGTYANNNGAVTSTVPFTWAAGDGIDIAGRYRMTTKYS